MKPPTPGLRRLQYRNVSAGKVQINVPPGDELVVSDAVADQLQRADTSFKSLEVASPEPSAADAHDAAPDDDADGSPPRRRRRRS